MTPSVKPFLIGSDAATHFSKVCEARALFNFPLPQYVFVLIIKKTELTVKMTALFMSNCNERQISVAGQLYITGGCRNFVYHDIVTDVDVVDVDSDAVTHTPPMRNARFGHATAASATSLFVFGGENRIDWLSSCEEFNTETMT